MTGTLEGPGYPPPGHLATGYSSTGSIISGTGQTRTYQIDQSATDELAWGPRPAISMDGSQAAALTFAGTSSDGLTATWTGATSLLLANNTTQQVFVRFTAVILEGTATGWKTAADEGAVGGATVVADIDGADLSTFKVQLLYEASYDGTTWVAAKTLYDSAATPSGASNLKTSTFGDFFWNETTDTSITASPEFETQSTTADFTFASNEDGVTYLVSLDGGEFTEVDSTASFSGLGVGQHTLVVKAVDARGFADATPEEFTWTVVEPPNADPVDIALTGSSIREFAANGAVVGTLATQDVDSSSFTYTLLDSAGGRFALSGNKVVVADGLLLDFEQQATHVIQVQVSDGEGGTLTENLTISLTDIALEVLTGDTRANTFVGGSGVDVLDGGAGNDRLQGGAGKDKLKGGMGSDVFVFTLLGEVGDKVGDFGNVKGDNDRFEIDASAFGGDLVEGTRLSRAQFQVADDNVLEGRAERGIRFIFEEDETRLWFDSNGSRSGGLTLVADLQANATMRSDDIWLV